MYSWGSKILVSDTLLRLLYVNLHSIKCDIFTVLSEYPSFFEVLDIWLFSKFWIFLLSFFTCS